MVLSKLKQKVFGRKVAPADVRQALASTDFNPIFFLSTGRCGTRWFTELLQEHKNIDVHHNTGPELYEQSLLAYNLYKSGKSDHEDVRQLLEEIIYCARQDLMVESLRKGHRFIETNNRISFFIPQLARLFPHAKFVHLYRDPAGFVKSGMNRAWYDGARYDYARPVSKDDNWPALSRVGKIAWLWRETNEMIEHQLAAIPKPRSTQFNFSSLSTTNVVQLLDWLEITPDVSKVSKMIETPVNAQKKGDFPGYEKWTEADRRDFYDACGDYATHLGFEYKP